MHNPTAMTELPSPNLVGTFLLHASISCFNLYGKIDRYIKDFQLVGQLARHWQLHMSKCGLTCRKHGKKNTIITQSIPQVQNSHTFTGFGNSQQI